MKNPELESHLRNAVENMVPDILDNILSQCEDRKGEVIEMKSRESKLKKSWVKPLVSTAAVLAVLAGGVIGMGYYQRANAVDPIIYMDVNPSIEIKANKNDIVLSVNGLNEDGEKLISQQKDEGKKLKGEKLETVAKEMASKIAEEGYFDELKNSVLVSVQNDDAKRCQELEDTLMASIKKAMSENGIDGAVMGQTIVENEELKSLAEELGISLGKVGLIDAVLENHPELSHADLSQLGINDLILLAAEWAKNSEDIKIIGTPSNEKYQSARLAIEKACENAGLLLGEGVGTESVFGFSEGKLVYNVKISIGDTQINYDVDANSGNLDALVSAITDAAVKEIGEIAENSKMGESAKEYDYQKTIEDAITGAVSALEEKEPQGDGWGGGLQSAPDIKDAVTGIINSGIDYFKSSLF